MKNRHPIIRVIRRILLLCFILITCKIIYDISFNKETDWFGIKTYKTISTSSLEQNTADTISLDQSNIKDSQDIDIIPSDSKLVSEVVSKPLTKEKLTHHTKELGDATMKNSFYSEKISEDVKSRIKGKSYGDGCTVPFEELRYIQVLYYGFDKETHTGEMIVNKAICDDVIDIFKELYEAKYPIEKMVLVDEYNADDNTSMAANNSSSFNYRLVPGSNHLSKHSLGLAIDINPLYNPYVQYNDNETVILPEEGIPYADRSLDCRYYIDKHDLCYKAFTKRGFTWGGIWTRDPDYQHFEKDID